MGGSQYDTRLAQRYWVSHCKHALQRTLQELALSSLLRHCRKQYDIVVLSPRNYFLFTALLPQVATGNLEEHSIIESVRKILGRKVDCRS